MRHDRTAGTPEPGSQNRTFRHESCPRLHPPIHHGTPVRATKSHVRADGSNRSRESARRCRNHPPAGAQRRLRGIPVSALINLPPPRNVRKKIFRFTRRDRLCGHSLSRRTVIGTLHNHRPRRENSGATEKQEADHCATRDQIAIKQNVVLARTSYSAPGFGASGSCSAGPCLASA